MTIEAQTDIAGLQRVGRIVSLVLHKMLDSIEPGMTMGELIELASGCFGNTVRARLLGSSTISLEQPALVSVSRHAGYFARLTD
jgi:methionine aminopeptidase